MAVQTCSESRKRSPTEENFDEDSGANEGYETPEPIGRKKHKQSRSPAQLEENSHPTIYKIFVIFASGIIGDYASKAQINQVKLRFLNMPCLHMSKTSQETLLSGRRNDG